MNNVFKIFVDWLIIIILINYIKIKINKNFFWKYLVNYIIISSDVWRKNIVLFMRYIFYWDNMLKVSLNYL